MNVLDDLLAQLESSDESGRVYAAEDIGYLNDSAAVPALIERLEKETSTAVSDVILQALTRIEGDAAIEATIRLLGSEAARVRNGAVEVLRRKGDSSIPFLQRVMRTGDKDQRKLVLDVLSDRQVREASGIYAAALSDPDINVVITAVEHLGGIRAEEFRNAIEGLLHSGSDPMLIAACLEALVGIDNPASLPAIRRLFGGPAVLPDFFLPLYFKVLAAFGKEAEFRELVKLLRRQPQLRSTMLEALMAIYPRCSSLDPPEDLLEVLQPLVEDSTLPLCGYQAVRILGFWAAREQFRPFLISCLSSKDRLVRLGAAESLRSERDVFQQVMAARALEEADEEVRQALLC
jgi:HEAT repeat protein